MTHEKWLILHLMLAVLFGWCAYKSRTAVDRIIWLAVILIIAIDYFIGLIFPAFSTFPLGI